MNTVWSKCHAKKQPNKNEIHTPLFKCLSLQVVNMENLEDLKFQQESNYY